jgi:hypothetical protein
VTADWPDWLEAIWQREASYRDDLTAVTAEAQRSLTDLDALADETARTNCPLTAATNLFGETQ